MRRRRIQVIGKLKPEVDVDLLARAILSIVEHQLNQQTEDQRDHGDTGDAA